MDALPLTKAALALLAAMTMALPVSTAAANEKDKKFFRQVEGTWSGPGEIVAGKFKGTKFVCNFTGSTPADKVGMALDGGCRVGLFTQPMQAIVHKSEAGYRGSFMDGSDGDGLDVVGGKVEGRKVVLSLNRNQLNGAMLARLPDDNTMNVTVSVLVGDDMVPVIGMSLKRVDGGTVGSLANR